ncbi:MAG TPA: hypothetical protein DC049_05075, partial [Spirochaetia bacterium]|nr:hypothetical protein [Spirochaetia bacterium]
KIREGSLNALDLLGENKIHLIINTLSHDKNTLDDEKKMRRRAIQLGVPIVTTIQAAIALSTGLEHYLAGDLTVNSLQNWNAELRISK